MITSLICFSFCILLILFLFYYTLRIHRKLKITEQILLSTIKLVNDISCLSQTSSESQRDLTKVVVSLEQDLYDFKVSSLEFSKEVTDYLDKLAGSDDISSGVKKTNLN